jgi:hypothetical protein
MVPVLSNSFAVKKNTTIPTRLNCGRSLISLMDNKAQDSSIVDLALNMSTLLPDTVQMARTHSGELQTTALNVLLSLCDKASEKQLNQIVKSRLLPALKILVEHTSLEIKQIASETISQICAGGSSKVLAAVDTAQIMATIIPLAGSEETTAKLKKTATESVLFYFHSSTIEQALEHMDRGAMEIVSNTLLLPDDDDLVKEALLVLQLLLGTDKFVTTPDFEKVKKCMDLVDAWTRLTTLCKESADGDIRNLAEILSDKERSRARLTDVEVAAELAEVADDQVAAIEDPNILNAANEVADTLNAADTLDAANDEVADTLEAANDEVADILEAASENSNISDADDQKKKKAKTV